MIAAEALMVEFTLSDAERAKVLNVLTGLDSWDPILGPRCDWTDLHVSTCGHCLGHPEAHDYDAKPTNDPRTPFGPR